MAMPNQNYGYPRAASHMQPPYATSTPLNVRSQRPRFAYSVPPSYPRPRSWASKSNPNPYYTEGGYRPFNSFRKGDYMMDQANRANAGMMNSYGSNEGFMMTETNANYGNMNDYSQPENYTDNPIVDSLRSQVLNTSNAADSMVNNYGNSVSGLDSTFSSDKSAFKSNNSTYTSANESYYTCESVFKTSPEKQTFGNALPPQGALFRTASFSNTRPGLLGTPRNPNTQSTFRTFDKPWGKNFPKKKMATGPKKDYRCELCSIDFTSSVPYEMHLRGSRHAKKIKALGATQVAQVPGSDATNVIQTGTVFRCDLCNVLANSSGQLQTHLDGTKHKNKLDQQRIQEARDRGEEIEPSGTTAATSEVNGKSNGGTVRPLPADFDNPQPAKVSKFMCIICQVHMNSHTQLQQHLESKKHQAKVEGKPLIKKKTKENIDNNSAANETMEVEGPAAAKSADGPKSTVVGVKTLATCFVQGGTLN